MEAAKKCRDARTRFSIVGDLLYPATLGAGIAWWVEAAVRVNAQGTWPFAALWTLAFGAFFLLYHSRSFVVLRESVAAKTKDSKTFDYSVPEFTKDLIDCASLILALACLRLADGEIGFVNPVGVFLVAALIPLGALITQAQRGLKTWGMRLFAFVIAVVGVVAGALRTSTETHIAFSPSGVESWLLYALWILLLIYCIWPSGFGARDTSSSAPPRGENLRTALAAGVFLFLLPYIWSGIQSHTAATRGEAPRWVLAGIVHNFDPGKPCSATPDIANQIPAVIASLQTMAPSHVQVIGVADVMPLSLTTRDFVGNNSGLAHMRAECIIRWLRTSKDLIGVTFINDDDLPRNFQAPDSMDRAVVVMALAQPSSASQP